ncbi:MAG: hypothetical protein WC508_04320 [Patescibacteria group bacterium]
MPKKIKIVLLSFLFFSLTFGLMIPLPTFAACDVSGTPWLEAINIPDGLLIPCECVSSNINPETDCLSFDVFLQTIINFSNLLLALTGSAALLMFMYGGTMLIIAGGVQERVQKGKAALQAAAIGIAIILGSWVIVNFVILALTEGKIGTQANLFNGLGWSQQWSASPKGQ